MAPAPGPLPAIPCRGSHIPHHNRQAPAQPGARSPVQPLRFSLPTSAPCLSRTRAHSRWPSVVARCSGVRPRGSSCSMSTCPGTEGSAAAPPALPCLGPCSWGGAWTPSPPTAGQLRAPRRVAPRPLSAGAETLALGAERVLGAPRAPGRPLPRVQPWRGLTCPTQRLQTSRSPATRGELSLETPARSARCPQQHLPRGAQAGLGRPGPGVRAGGTCPGPACWHRRCCQVA